MNKDDNELLGIDFSKLDNLELSELLAVLEGIDDALKVQEDIVRLRKKLVKNLGC